MPENQNFYIIRHGIRWSGMPAWKNVLSDNDTWKLTALLSHLNKLPSAVQQEWQNPSRRPGGKGDEVGIR